MAEMKNEYRLSRHGIDYFTKAFRTVFENGPTYVGNLDRAPGHSSNANQYALYQPFNEESDPYFFEVLVDAREGAPTDTTIGVVSRALTQIIAMDDAARLIPDKHDQNEELAQIAVSTFDKQISFHYYATIWNNEWSVHFQIDEEGGWELLGIPNWKEPGAYIR